MVPYLCTIIIDGSLCTVLIENMSYQSRKSQNNSKYIVLKMISSRPMCSSMRVSKVLILYNYTFQTFELICV